MEGKYLPIVQVEFLRENGKVEYEFFHNISKEEFEKLDKIYGNKIRFPFGSFDDFFPKTIKSIEYIKEV